MNREVLKYCKEVEVKFNNFCKEQLKIIKSFKKPEYDVLCSDVQERILRLKLEKIKYNIDDNNNLEKVAISTLKEDFIENYTNELNRHKEWINTIKDRLSSDGFDVFLERCIKNISIERYDLYKSILNLQ